MGSATPPRLKRAGYVQHEYVASGTASSYRAEAELSKDGRWTFAPDGTAGYRTRVLVRRPTKAADFSGTVVVEWLNVSGGLDADPDYTSLREELLRHGDAWVGVSAQLIGVEGGPVLVTVPNTAGLQGEGLKAIDAARYGSLDHPGDGYSFDMYTQVARAIRAGTPAMGRLKARRIIAAGESQSAIALTTYINGVQPLTHAFDGFFVHSRAAVPLPLVGPGKYADLAGGITTQTPTILRTDTDVPVLDLQAESDVTGVLSSVDGSPTRQPPVPALGSGGDRARRMPTCSVRWPRRLIAGRRSTTERCTSSRRPGCTASTDGSGPANHPPRRPASSWHRARVPRSAGTATASRAAGSARLRSTSRSRFSRVSPVPIPISSASCSARPSRCPPAGSPLGTPRRAAYRNRYDAAVRKTIKAGFALNADRAALEDFAIPSRVEK